MHNVESIIKEDLQSFHPFLIVAFKLAVLLQIMSYQLADVPFEVIGKVCLLGELKVIPSLVKLPLGFFIHHEFD